MKNVVAVGKFVVGKNADVVVRIADTAGQVSMLIDQALAGKTIGIQPQVPVNKKANIAEVEEIVAGLNKTVGQLANAETAAAKQQPKGDGSVSNQFKNRDEWAEAQQIKAGAGTNHRADRADRNQNVGRFQNHAITVANQRFLELGDYPVTVTAIEWFERADRFNRLGALHVSLPLGYADVRFYDNTKKQAFWYDFCDFALNQFKPTFNPLDGSGELTLAIREGKDGGLYVNLPKSEHNGVYYDKLRCRDVRFGIAHSDNNRNLEAALTAYLRFFVGEFVQANPANRHGIDEHCGACKFNMYVPGYDGLDNEIEGYKNTLNTSDTIEMVQWGNEIPRRFCMVNKELVDLEITKEINELMATDITTFYDEEGNLRQIGPNEVVIAGKSVNKYVALKNGTMDRCAGCAFYHNNAAKTDKQISKEKAAGADYVSKYWSEDARAERMPIQTLINNGRHEEWVLAYPGEVEDPINFRVYGVGGVVVEGSTEVARAAKEGGVLAFVPMTEEENVAESRAAKIINVIHETCNNYGTIAQTKPKALEDLSNLIAKKPTGLSNRMEKRWTGAVERLVATIQEFASK